MTVLIFDFDGTIADSFEVILRISNQLAIEFGYPVAHPDEIETLKNLSSREIVQRSGISRWKLPFLLRRLQRELNQDIGQLQLFPGMKETLLTLQEQGNRLGIVTSNSCDNVNAFLAAQNLTPAFEFVGSGLSLFGKGRIIQRQMRRYQIDAAEVLYVGDETRDIEAAHNIGIPVVAVSWGFNSSQILAAAHPDYLIHRPQDLLQIVQP
jgi:HAD superfamily hydrolase (TIGR01549 family)